MDPALNATCITGCIRPTPTDSLYILSGMVPPEIRQNAASSREHHQKSTDERHPLFGHAPARSRLKSRKSFLNAVNPSDVAEDIRSACSTERLDNHPSRSSMSIRAKEELPPGADSSWAEWKCINRLKTGTG